MCIQNQIKGNTMENKKIQPEILTVSKVTMDNKERLAKEEELLQKVMNKEITVKDMKKSLDDIQKRIDVIKANIDKGYEKSTDFNNVKIAGKRPSFSKEYKNYIKETLFGHFNKEDKSWNIPIKSVKYALLNDAINKFKKEHDFNGKNKSGISEEDIIQLRKNDVNPLNFDESIKKFYGLQAKIYSGFQDNRDKKRFAGEREENGERGENSNSLGYEVKFSSKEQLFEAMKTSKKELNEMVQYCSEELLNNKEFANEMVRKDKWCLRSFKVLFKDPEYIKENNFPKRNDSPSVGM